MKKIYDSNGSPAQEKADKTETKLKTVAELFTDQLELLAFLKIVTEDHLKHMQSQPYDVQSVIQHAMTQFSAFSRLCEINLALVNAAIKEGPTGFKMAS